MVLQHTDKTEHSFKRSFFKNVLVSGGYNYLSQGLLFLSSMITARLLLPDNYGLVGLITVFTGFISIFADSGISLAVIKSDLGRSYHKALDNIATYMGICLCVLTIVLSYPIALLYDDSRLFLPTIVLSSTFLFRSIGIVRAALLSKNLQFDFLGKVLLFNTIINITSTVILAYFGFQYWAIVIPQVIVSIVPIFLYEWKVRLGYGFSKFTYVKVAFKYTKAIIGSLVGFNLVNYWARNSDNLIVGKMYGTSDLGIYNRAYSLLTLPLTLITGLMGAVLYPSLKKLKMQGGEIFKEYLFVLRIITLIVFPVSVVLILFPDELVSLLWGDAWIKVGQLLPYFGILILSQSLLSTSGSILVLQGREKALMYSGWVGAVLLISAIAVGALFSLVSIAQLYSITFVALVLPFNIYYIFYKSLGFNWQPLLKFWSPILLLSILLWVACYFNLSFLKVAAIMILFTNTIVSSRNEVKKGIRIILDKSSKLMLRKL